MAVVTAFVGCTHSIDRLLQPRNVPRRWSGGFGGFRSCDELGLIGGTIFATYCCFGVCVSAMVLATRPSLLISNSTFFPPGYHALGYHARVHTTHPPAITLPGYHAFRLSRHHQAITSPGPSQSYHAPAGHADAGYYARGYFSLYNCCRQTRRAILLLVPSTTGPGARSYPTNSLCKTPHHTKL